MRKITDHGFCRFQLRKLRPYIMKATTPEQRRESYAFKNSCGYEFHGPDGFYLFLGGKADCIFSARAEGWFAWLIANGTDFPED